MASAVNTQIVLKHRPDGMPRADNFDIVESPIPRPNAGEVFVRTIYLSVDPYMRGLLWERPPRGKPVHPGEVMIGEGVGEVVFSGDPRLREGAIVRGNFGWQKYAIAKPETVHRVDSDITPMSTALGVLGMPGLTGHHGIRQVARPLAGETVVVSGAAGAVGSVAGQIAKIDGCRVVGICGTDAKCAHLVRELGFDASINYRSQPIDSALESVCPSGIDAIFDNVGGDILEAMLRHINLHARIALCGAISQYHTLEPDLVLPHSRLLHRRRACMQGFLVHDYAEHATAAMTDLKNWVKTSRLIYRESITNGLEHTPAAFEGLFHGTNFGKQLIRVSPESV